MTPPGRCTVRRARDESGKPDTARSPYHGPVTSTVASHAAPGAALRERPAMPARTYQVRTYGCQMNVHDSE
ncbi:MAG: hypothetical protein ACRDUT_07015, partial [Mycobacterium sp.]